MNNLHTCIFCIKHIFTAITWGITFIALSGCSSSDSDAPPNTAPTAYAGLPQIADTGQAVNLDGRDSFDNENDTLSYLWVLTSLPSTSQATLNDDTSPTPTFIADVSGVYLLTLVVNDGTVNSEESTMTVTSKIPGTNTIPLADAGDSRFIKTGNEFTLNGDGSSDADGDPLTYTWLMTAKPLLSTANLTDGDTITPSFVPDLDGIYSIELVVSDGFDRSVPNVITLTAIENNIPVADAGPDQTERVERLVTLDGSDSFDLDGDPITYLWSFTAVPTGTTEPEITAATTVNPTFTPTDVGTYRVTLVVNDGEADSEIAIVSIISIVNTAPIADAGIDQAVMTEVLVNLDGSNSSDINNDVLTYLWSVSSRPAGSASTLTGAATATPSFTPDANGEYVFSLLVNDGLLYSDPDTVTITSTGLISYAVVDTNQSTCYNSSTGSTSGCSGVGHDADYAGFQPSYTLTNAGLTVTDNITDLVWQQSSDINTDGNIDYNDKFSQSDALSYCNSLTLASRNDWRLPSVKELYSLMLFSGRDASSYLGTNTATLTPFINNSFDWAFGDLTTAQGMAANDRIIDAQYATSTLNVAQTMVSDDSTFGVNFVDGRIKAYPIATKLFYVRCVAGNVNYGVNDFNDNGDQTISDAATGLMWQKTDNEPANWDQAVSECESASTASQNDWRLPNIKELHSIVNYSRSPDTTNSAAIDALFTTSSFLNEESITDFAYYWASTTHVDNDGDGTNATYISFGRALGYINPNILDAHGAGAQRSNDKLDVINEVGAASAVSNGTFYYKGPQGDILRINNKVRCVRDI